MKTRLAVIGAGPGGYVAAFHAADLGMQVALIDADPNPGGVCTFRGCIPSKALLHAARVLDEAKHATAFGVSFAKPSIDVDRLRAWKDQVVKKQTGGLGLLAKSIHKPTVCLVWLRPRRSRVTASMEDSGDQEILIVSVVDDVALDDERANAVAELWPIAPMRGCSTSISNRLKMASMSRSAVVGLASSAT